MSVAKLSNAKSSRSIDLLKHVTIKQLLLIGEHHGESVHSR